MTHLKFLIVIFVLVCNQACNSIKTDYYWREYTGEIPNDAIVAGKDINSKNIYVGQAYIKNGGLMVAQLTPGIREVNVPLFGIKKINKYTKILCGPQEKFYWMQGDSKSLHLTLINKHAVIGGHQDDLGYISIGRISHEGEIKVGKINSFSAESANFYFNDNGGERLINSYEILMYGDNDKVIDVRIDSQR